MRRFKKILIANRGEIAIRVMRSAREMGISTVAIYSEIDRHALHLRFADECFPLVKAGIEPYLDIEQIIRVALNTGADAIHPGYGFLSENANFARKVEEAGIVFIGPHHEAIHRMGDKMEAKKLAAEVGLPLVPGFDINPDSDLLTISNDIRKIGFPVLIKATAGGGGKGMRLIESEDTLEQGITRAMNEALDAFGDGRIFIEKYIENPRHIEFQILADNYGNCIHLFERECSIQRRHQKVIEEAPSSLLTESIRDKMGRSAVALAKACTYRNAGTIEFIVDEHLNYYFLEMNTRLQVEHPVTELITGIDLVKQQIMIAEGRKLQFTQSAIKIGGHAMEVRVCAEDPENNFLPDTGVLIRYRPPDGPGVRVDGGIDEGMTIPVEYDPLMAKLIVSGADRAEVIQKMKRAISEFELVGVRNTLGFCDWVMQEADFCAGKFNTHFISQKFHPEATTNSGNVSDEFLAAAVLAFELNQKESFRKAPKSTNCQNNWRKRLN